MGSFLILAIITIPSFVSILNGQYFSMHDDQHIARLYLLNQGILQGDIYPRWVDTLGFGFGYPLFNFYPPLIYYLGALFHLLGFSYIWSMKLVVIAGFSLSALGMFLLARKIVGKNGAILASALYTYFFYHGVTVYVRGALAEFFAMAVLPFAFLALHAVFEKPALKSFLFFGIMVALLILTHPLIAFPALLFMAALVLYYFLLSKKRITFLLTTTGGFLYGLGMSSFFWLPSIAERKFTMIDEILTTELASYKIHFVCLEQFLYSAFTYGGSIPGCEDGFTFQLGRFHLALLVGSLVLGAFYILKNKFGINLRYHLLFLLLLVFSLFMTTEYSLPIWSSISYLSYLQFPWRFLTFAAIFISLIGGYFVFFLEKLEKNIGRYGFFVSLILVFILVFKYSGYFRPQRYLNVDDKKLTSYEEIAWRVSRTSFEFVPKGLPTKKSALNTTILNIDKTDIWHRQFDFLKGAGDVRVEKSTPREKVFSIDSKEGLRFRLNTFMFPGWQAKLDGEPIIISDDNPYKLITVDLPEGSHLLKFSFEDTPIRKIGKITSLLFGLTFVTLLIISINERDKSPHT